MEIIKNKKYKDMTQEEKLDLEDYLTRELWDKNKSSIICPVCGGTIVSRDIGTSNITKCNTEGCVYISLRGI